jgi:hypothetical protein
MIKNNHLENLKQSGIIHSYEYVGMDEEGNIGQKSSFRNSQRLAIYFNGGESITIDCFCSGSSQNTVLVIAEE